MALLLLAVACLGAWAPPDPGSPPVDSSVADSGGSTRDTAGIADSARDEDSAAGTWACPAGTSPVPSERPSFCIDTYEVAEVEGAWVSGPGLVPAVGRTFEEAALACAAWPPMDAAGVVYGARHLATAQEWEDAGDGQVGEGGSPFPWGDTFDDTRCVTLTEGGVEQFEGTQLTGSMPGCVSVLGVVDQVGNTWEWTDPGVVLDSATALAALAEDGISLTTAADSALILAGGAASALTLDVAGLQPGGVAAAEDGHLHVTADQIQPLIPDFFARGYLRGLDPTAPGVPVRLVSTDPADATAPWWVHVAPEYDGRPLPDKRGCAWYAGFGAACALSEASLVHVPDFRGTIGFRCVAPPYPVSG